MAEDARTSRAGRWFLVLLQVAILVALAWWIWRSLAPQFADLRAADLTRWAPDPLMLAVSTALLVTVFVAHGLLWRRILVDLGLGRPRARQALRIYLLAGLGRYIPGKLWQFAGLAVLAGRAGLAPGAAAACQVLGQLAFLTTGLLTVAFFLPDLWGGTGAILGALALVAAATGAWLLVTTDPGRAARGWLVRRAPGRVRDKLAAVFELVDRVRPGLALGWVASYGFTWLVLGAAFTLFVAAFIPGAGALWRSLTGTVAASYLVGYAFLLAPAGLGVREGSMLGILTAAFAGWGGSPPGVVGALLVVTAASRIWFTAGELLPLALLPLLPGGGADAPDRGSSAP